MLSVVFFVVTQTAPLFNLAARLDSKKAEVKILAIAEAKKNNVSAVGAMLCKIVAVANDDTAVAANDALKTTNPKLREIALQIRSLGQMDSKEQASAFWKITQSALRDDFGLNECKMIVFATESRLTFIEKIRTGERNSTDDHQVALIGYFLNFCRQSKIASNSNTLLAARCAKFIYGGDLTRETAISYLAFAAKEIDGSDPVSRLASFLSEPQDPYIIVLALSTIASLEGRSAPVLQTIKRLTLHKSKIVRDAADVAIAKIPEPNAPEARKETDAEKANREAAELVSKKAQAEITAEKMLIKAKSRADFNKIISDYPNTKAAEKAAAWLKKIDKK